jgi:hypothetical protein
MATKEISNQRQKELKKLGILKGKNPVKIKLFSEKEETKPIQISFKEYESIRRILIRVDKNTEINREDLFSRWRKGFSLDQAKGLYTQAEIYEAQQKIIEYTKGFNSIKG